MDGDYSITKVSNRLAMEGEELVAHKFRSGWMRMVPRSDYSRWRTLSSQSSRILDRAVNEPGRRLKSLLSEFFGFMARIFLLDGEPGPVVAFPADALLRIYGISGDLQQEYNLSSMEDALFVEITERIGRSRDALCFGNGAVIPLQYLQEGQRVKVLYRSWTESLEPSLEPCHLRI